MSNSVPLEKTFGSQGSRLVGNEFGRIGSLEFLRNSSIGFTVIMVQALVILELWWSSVDII